MLDEQQERLIAQGLRDGKAEAWQALYDAFAHQVWHGVARLLGPNVADVADVVQETMIAAARSARTFEPAKGSLWGWLWGIARNHLALRYRKQEQHHRLLKTAAALAESNGRAMRWLEGKEPSPPEALEATELAEMVRATLATLSSEYEMLLTARYLDGDKVALIAERERSSEVAVRSRLARARQAFREAFAQQAQ